MKIFSKGQLVVPDVTKSGENGPGVYYIITEGVTEQKSDSIVRYIACRLSNTDDESFAKLGVSFELDETEKDEFKCYLGLPHHQCHCIMKGRIAVPSAYKNELVARAEQEAAAKEAELQAERERIEQLMQNMSEEDLLEMQRIAAEQNQKLIETLRLAERELSNESHDSIFRRLFPNMISNAVNKDAEEKKEPSMEQAEKGLISNTAEENKYSSKEQTEKETDSNGEQIEKQEGSTKTRRSRTQK